MTEAVTAPEPRLKRKAFAYRTALRWLGGRAGTIASSGKPGFRVASPPEFKGESGVWTPEDLFVAAVNVCTMTTYAAFSQRLELPIVSYESEAEGTLEFVDGGYRFTRVVLRPIVLVSRPEAVAQAEKTLHEAHAACIISNSIRCPVEIEAIVRPA